LNRAKIPPSARHDTGRSNEPPYEVLLPKEQTLPMVLASPHSGRRYGEAFLRQAQLGELALRRSEDAYVDEIFATAPDIGAPLIRALFPRTFVDANREPLELDTDMFWESLPWRINRSSPRVRSGLGVIARVGANGASIYDAPLSAAEARTRLRGYYFPYHRALRQLIRQTRDRFGYAILIDCHSMPSQAVSRTSAMPRLAGGAARGIDMVLGDCHGAACMPQLTDCAEQALIDLGYTVVRNSPYAGGFTTRHYGRPDNRVHALQIEVNRKLYMDEARLEPAEGLGRLRTELAGVIGAIGAVAPFARAAE
jgi:N-formylglutamate amidohydrolase